MEKNIWQRQHSLNDAIEQIKVDRVIKIVDEVKGGSCRSSHATLSVTNASIMSIRTIITGLCNIMTKMSFKLLCQAHHGPI